MSDSSSGSGVPSKALTYQQLARAVKTAIRERYGRATLADIVETWPSESGHALFYRVAISPRGRKPYPRPKELVIKHFISLGQAYDSAQSEEVGYMLLHDSSVLRRREAVGYQALGMVRLDKSRTPLLLKFWGTSTDPNIVALSKINGLIVSDELGKYSSAEKDQTHPIPEELETLLQAMFFSGGRLGGICEAFRERFQEEIPDFDGTTRYQRGASILLLKEHFFRFYYALHYDKEFSGRSYSATEVDAFLKTQRIDLDQKLTELLGLREACNGRVTLQHGDFNGTNTYIAPEQRGSNLNVLAFDMEDFAHYPETRDFSEAAVHKALGKNYLVVHQDLLNRGFNTFLAARLAYSKFRSDRSMAERVKSAHNEHDHAQLAAFVRANLDLRYVADFKIGTYADFPLVNVHLGAMAGRRSRSHGVDMEITSVNAIALKTKTDLDELMERIAGAREISECSNPDAAKTYFGTLSYLLWQLDFISIPIFMSYARR